MLSESWCDRGEGGAWKVGDGGYSELSSICSCHISQDFTWST